MVTVTLETPEREGTVNPPCRDCGHAEDEHVEREAEVAGATLRRTYCESCEDWHDFAPPPGDI